MNTRIEMIKVMARPEIMGPAIGDSRERLIRERAELEDRLKIYGKGRRIALMLSRPSQSLTLGSK